MKTLTKNKTEYKVIFICEDNTIDTERTERFDYLINKKQLGILGCNELETYVSALHGSFYMDDLRDETIKLIDYHMNQIRDVNGLWDFD